MEERDDSYYARRRKFWQFYPQEELAAIIECQTDEEIGRYYRARVIAEQSGCVNDAARAAAGDGPALECIERAGLSIEEDVQRYRETVEKKTAAINKRWHSAG